MDPNSSDIDWIIKIVLTYKILKKKKMLVNYPWYCILSPVKRDDFIKLKRMERQILRGKGLLNMFVLLSYLSQDGCLRLKVWKLQINLYFE
jgi:hypothetical protein